MSYMENQMDNLITGGVMQKEIFDGNKIIAEFDGWKFEQIEPDYYSGEHNGLMRWKVSLRELKSLMINGFRFHSKWDKLMPIIEKIETIAPSRVIIDCKEVRIVKPKGRDIKVQKESKLESAYEAVIQFIWQLYTLITQTVG